MERYSPEDRQSICDMFRRLLEAKADEPRLREIIQTESGFDSALWLEMADLGLTGILVPTECAGSGASLEEVEALMEVAGSFLLTGPFIESCVIAPTLLSACDDRGLAQEWLGGIAAGTAIVSIAGCGDSGDWTAPPDVVATHDHDGWRLEGSAHFVSYAHVAGSCLVYATTEDGPGVFVVATDDAGLSVTLHQSNDRTLRLSTLSFNKAKAERLSGVGSCQWREAINTALVALAGEQVGGSQRIFSLTTEYLKTRHQFGQPIGKFQSLKHIAADLLVELESAVSAAREAARSVAADREDSDLLSYLAAFTCADNYQRIAADAIQLHGGIAYTVEHPAHLYWRRARSGQWLYASSDRLRDLYLSEMEKKL